MMLNNEFYTYVFRNYRGRNSWKFRSKQAVQFMFLHRICMNYTKMQSERRKYF